MTDQTDNLGNQYNQDRREINIAIMSLLEENRRDMKDLHDFMYETRDIALEMQKCFIGISPADHIRDHSALTKADRDSTAQKMMYRNILGTIIGAVLIASGTWVYTHGTEILTGHVKIEYTAPYALTQAATPTTQTTPTTKR